MPIKPDPEDFDEVDRIYGRLPATASDAERGNHHRLAIATKMVRLGMVVAVKR